MSEEPAVTTTEIDDYGIRIEEYEDFVTCTIVGPHTTTDVVAVGDVLYAPWTVLKPHDGALPLPWGIVRFGLSETVPFQRYDASTQPSLTYGFRDGTGELGVLASSMDAIRQSLSLFLDEEHVTAALPE